MIVEQRILKDIDWLRFPNTPIKFYYLKEHIIVEFNEIDMDKKNNGIKYAIYYENGEDFDSRLYTSFEQCLLEIAIKNIDDNKDIMNAIKRLTSKF